MNYKEMKNNYLFAKYRVSILGKLHLPVQFLLTENVKFVKQLSDGKLMSNHFSCSICKILTGNK